MLPIERLEPRALLSTVPAGFTDSTFADGLAEPTAFAFAPDGRLFVTEQAGDLRVIKNSQLLSTPFLTHSVNADGERGLLGIAFDPAFTTNHHLYLYYTTSTSPIHNRVSRFTADGDAVVPSSEQVIFNLDNLSNATNHNGGAIHFGPDGKLYIAAGENANPPKAQSLDTVLGKILRINPDGSIPTDNPFYGSTSGKNRAIFAYGLRNPYTFTFQPGTGKMMINDVGQNTYEEIDVGTAGANYGWPAAEGPSTDSRFTAPIYSYSHNYGCAITGGVFYNPSTVAFPASYVGKYFFSDYCSGWIKVLNPATHKAANFATGVGSPVNLDIGPDGNLYYVDIGGGRIGMISAPAVAPPTVTGPEDTTAAIGQTVTFSVSVSGQGPFTYQWQRNNTDIPGATKSSYNFGPADPSNNNDSFTVRVTSPAGPSTSDPAILTVTSNHAPVVTLQSPSAGTRFRAGTTISFSGSAGDAEDGPLADAGLSWQAVQVDEDHLRPVKGPVAGQSAGAFTIPRNALVVSPDAFYRVILTATDADGATNTATLDFHPQLVRVYFKASPSSIAIRLNGQPLSLPNAVTCVVGTEQRLDAFAMRIVRNRRYRFLTWSDGKSRVHTIIAPSQRATYTVRYTPA